MPAEKLTDRAIRALKPGPKPYKRFDGRGLYLEVMPAGSKLWRLQYRAVRSRDGKRVQQVLALGRYGSLADEVGVERARELAAEARAQLKVGRDPMGDRRRDRGGQASSLRGLAEEWADKQPWEPRTARRERQILAHWLPALGSLAASSVLPADIRPVLLAIEASGRGDTAHRVRAQMGRVLRYGVVREVCEQGCSDWNSSAFGSFPLTLSTIGLSIEPGETAIIANVMAGLSTQQRQHTSCVGNFLITYEHTPSGSPISTGNASDGLVVRDANLLDI